MLIIWIVSPVFIADFLSALAMISCKGLSFLCWSWRDYFYSCQCQHNMPAGYWGSWISINSFLLWCCSWLLALLACTRESSSWRNFTGGVPLVLWKVCWGRAKLTCDQKNWWGKGWARVLDEPWFGACFNYFWLIESCYLLIEQVHSVLTPHSGHSCGTSLFARKWTCRCCLWVVVCTLG